MGYRDPDSINIEDYADREEEGILQESDRELIQSVVEFGDKTVREAMTPRPEMVAVPLDTTVEQYIELLRSRRFSRDS